MTGSLAVLPSEDKLRHHHQRVDRMLHDRALAGDLLAVGLVFGWMVDYLPSTEWRLHVVANALWPCPPHAHGPAWIDGTVGKIRGLLWADRPRYEPAPATGTCAAPVRGRDTPCGRKASGSGVTLTDPDSGTVHHRQACPRHADWLHGVAVRNRIAVDASGPIPTPRPNTGGILTRHLPEVDWITMLKTCNPDRTLTPVPPPVAQQPTPPPAPASATEPPYPELVLEGGGETTERRRGHLTLILGTGP